MFSLLLIKFLKLNYHSRLLIILSIIFISCLLIITIFFNLSADHLVRYLPDDAVIYLWFNQKKLQKNWAGTKLINRLLSENGIEDIDQHLLSGQLAQVCFSPKGEIICGLLLETNNPQKLQNELAAKDINYKKLASKVLAVSSDKTWLTIIDKKNYHLLTIKLQPRLWRAGDLTLYLQHPSIISNQETKIISLILKNKKEIILCGETNNAQLLLTTKCLWLTNLKPLNNNLPINNQSFDLIISAINLKTIITDWLISINKFDQNLVNRFLQVLNNYYFIDIKSELEKKIIAAKQIIISKKLTTSENDFLKQYNFFWQLELPDLSEEDLLRLEKIFSAILSQKNPKETTLYLNDGTKVIEILPNESQIKKEKNNDWTVLKTDNDFNLSYKYLNGVLSITNNYQRGDFSNNFLINDNFLYFKKDFYPKLKIFNLISDFNSLKYYNNFIEIY